MLVSRENTWTKQQKNALKLDKTGKLMNNSKIMGIMGTSVIEVGTPTQPADNSAKGRVTRSVSSESDKTTLWKKGPEKEPFYQGDKKKYFTITNLYNQKVLTAVEGTASLEIKGKPKHTVLIFQSNYLQILSKLSIDM